MKFRYEAYDKSGKRSATSIEAESAQDARRQLEIKGLYVTEISGADAPSAKKPTGNAKSAGGKNRLKNLAIFTRQLSVLVATGTPIVEALSTLEKQMRDPSWQAMIHDVRKRVEEGQPFSEALQAHPRAFDPIARNLVAAGEAGGNLDEMLRRLAQLTRQQEHLRGSVTGAMVYPAMLTTVSLGVLVMMIVVVIPRFAGLFDSIGAPMPDSTRMLLDISTLLRGYWWALIAGAVALAFGIRYYLRTPAGKRAWDGFVVSAPIFGTLARSIIVARVTRILGILLQSRVPMIEALELTRGSTTNTRYSDIVAKASEAVIDGDTLSSVLSRSDLVPESVAEAVRSGERSGQIGPVLSSLADFMDEDNDIAVKSLSSLIEPLILMLMGGLVAFIALSLFLPLFDLTSMTGAGAK